MTDEEKKAIEKLSGKKNESTWYDTIRQIKREEIKDVVVTRQKYITTIFNLIDKQSKEIEELKENYRRLQNTEAIQDIYIKKDKIKAKIDYLLKRYDSEEDYCTFEVIIKILQSLLKEE